MKQLNTLKKKREKLLKELCKMENILQGTLVEAYLKCGKRNCRCADDERFKHGPKFYLFYKEEKKPKMLYIRKEKINEVREGIRKYKRLKEILSQVCKINRELLKVERSKNDLN